MAGLFITATGTEIGKTFVTAGLLRAGIAEHALKPVVSGFDPENFLDSDPAILLDAMGRVASLPEIEQISPWRFKAPLSPDMAARREGQRIDFDAMTAFCRRGVMRPGLCLIEGVGGVAVPLDDTHTVLDWMEALALPAVLIAGTYLGTISHILTAAECLARRKLGLKLVVLNESAEGGGEPSELAATLSRFLGPVPILPLFRSAADFASIAALLN